MKTLALLLALLPGVLSAQIFGSTARRIQSGASLPALCSPNNGDVFLKTTATVGLYYCPVLNTWTLVGPGAGGPPSGAAGGDLGGSYPNPSVVAVGGVTAANVGAGANLANAATALNTPSTIVRRDASGNFAAGTITAALTGNSSTSSALAADPGDCTNQFARGINASGTAQCASVAGADFANQNANVVFGGPATAPAAAPGFRALVDADVPDTITLTNITQVTNRSHTSLSDIGTTSHANIDIHIAAGTAHASTSANTASAIVQRDASGDFAAGTVTLTALGIGVAPTKPLEVQANASAVAVILRGRDNGTTDEVEMYWRHNDGTTAHGAIIGDKSRLLVFGATTLLVTFTAAGPVWAGGTEGTCDSAAGNRGRIVMVQGGGGVADTFRICGKSAADAYSWAIVASW